MEFSSLCSLQRFGIERFRFYRYLYGLRPDVRIWASEAEFLALDLGSESAKRSSEAVEGRQDARNKGEIEPSLR